MEELGQGERPRQLDPESAETDQETDCYEGKAGQLHRRPGPRYPLDRGEARAPQAGGTREREQLSCSRFRCLAPGQDGHSESSSATMDLLLIGSFADVPPAAARRSADELASRQAVLATRVPANLARPSPVFWGVRAPPRRPVPSGVDARLSLIQDSANFTGAILPAGRVPRPRPRCGKLVHPARGLRGPTRGRG